MKKGKKGEDIPLQARILAVADTFDSMTAERPYRPTPGWDRALDELKKFSGMQFDPQVAEVFLRVIKRDREVPALSEAKNVQPAC